LTIRQLDYWHFTKELLTDAENPRVLGRLAAKVGRVYKIPCCGIDASLLVNNGFNVGKCHIGYSPPHEEFFNVSIMGRATLNMWKMKR